ncbi:MAG: hypothetical protein ACI8WB_001028 [Phenylobacterium sp.]|jgi:hypothetical protein
MTQQHGLEQHGFEQHCLEQHCLEQDMDWLQRCIGVRMAQFIDPAQPVAAPPAAPVLPVTTEHSSPYVRFVQRYQLNNTERQIVLMALAPELKPQLLDVFLLKNSDTGCGFSEFGGFRLDSFGGFLPDVRSALFVLAGQNLEQQLDHMAFFAQGCKLFTEDILRSRHDNAIPYSHHRLQLSEVALEQILLGQTVPGLADDFPAKAISTPLTWAHLVLSDNTREQLKELTSWIKMKDKWGGDPVMAQSLFQGYRCLFYGPSGTGKTLTASLLGKTAGLPVYRVDPAQLVSKYIGETEKNLEQVFKMAERQNWILFFDEADALFSQRTGVSNANDRHANQQVAYLLQRIETSSTVVILATNLKQNIDSAFARRFQSVVHFPLPDAAQRGKLWRNLFGRSWQFEPQINFKQLGQQYDLTGGAMNNVIRYCCLMAMEQARKTITYQDLMAGIRREYAKQHRSLAAEEVSHA